MSADWILIPCLRALFMEFDRIAPTRDHASDGSIGDTAHQEESSDHNADEVGNVPIHDADHVNEVHAIDVDNNLRQAGLTMEIVVQFMLARCRSGAEKRLRYIIYNRRIWSASSDWVQKTYTGASPHTEHAHFSASYTSGLEASTVTWGLIEEFGGDDMALPKKGDVSEEVAEFQYLLSELGYPTAQDKNYGPKMEASVNAYRAAFGQGDAAYISGWHAFHMRRAMAQKYAGKPGAPGAPGKDGASGRPGRDGKDAELTGRLTVTGGQLTVEAAA